MNIKKNKIPFIVLSYNKNKLLWNDLFLNYKKKISYNFEYILVTDWENNEDISNYLSNVPHVKTIISPHSNWAKMTQYGVTRLIEKSYEYSFFSFDDLFIQKADNNLIEESVNKINDNNLDSLRLAHVFSSNYKQYKGLRIDDNNEKYLTTLVFNIWRLKSLLELVEKVDNPWDFEVNGYKFINKKNSKIATLNKPAIKYKNLIVKGKQVLLTKNYYGFEKMSISKFILYSIKRGIIKFLKITNLYNFNKS